MIEYPLNPEPIRVEIEPTNICNANCIFCPRWNVRKPKGFLNLKNFSQFLDRLNEYRNKMWINRLSYLKKYPRIIFAGMGEPTLHPRIVDIVKEGSRRGFDTELVTNGAKLTGKLASKLAKAGLYRLSLSLHSLNPDIYYYLMRLELTEMLPRIEEALKALDETNVDVEIWKICTSESYNDVKNAEDEKSFREFLSHFKKKIRMLGPTPAWNRGGQMPAYKNWANVHDNDKIWCELLYFTLNIAWDGTTTMCCCDFPSITVPLGDAWKENIDVLQKRRNEIFNRPLSKPICKNCRRPKDQTYEELYCALKKNYELNTNLYESE